MSPQPARILLVDDEQSVQKLLSYPLRKEGYEVVPAMDGQEALERCRGQSFDLIVLDVMLPKIDGFDVCRQIRAQSSVPIIMLTAKAEEFDKVLGLELGADDYITKPFSAPELLARVRAGLRRNARGAEQTPVLKMGHVRIDLTRRQTHGPEGDIHLTPLEYRVLECLARRTGMVVRQRDLLREVWGPDREEDARGLRVCMKFLRDKLESDPPRPRYLVTETGLGYRLRTDETDAPSSPVETTH